LFAQVVGSSPSLPTPTIISICAIKLLGEATIKVVIGNLIGTLKGKYERMWSVMNILFVTIALCGFCGELAQR